MLIKNSVHKSHAILAALTLCICQVEGNNETGINQCANHEEKCNPHHQPACCNSDFTCKPKLSESDYFCRRRVLLGTPCRNDQDCSDILHAKCSKDLICVCRPNNIMVNETYCQPLLGSFCWKGEKCATDYASCVDNECQCDKNYIKQSNTRCLPNLIGSPCKTHSNCKTIKFSYCSTLETCTCSLNTLSNDDQTACLPLLNLYCETDDECKVDHSVCVDNWCKCKPLVITISNTECREPYIGMDCERDSDCAKFMNHSQCSQSNHCQCIDHHYVINSRTCAPAFNVACNNEPCAPENSVCYAYKCQCRPKYVFRGYKCVPRAFLGSPCQTDTDCQIIKFATCSDDYMCVCKTNFSESDPSTCIPLIGGSCTINDDCVTPNSNCFLNKCQCLDNFFAHSNDECTPISLEKTCKGCNDCNNIQYSYCSEDRECLCDINYIALNGTKCAQPLGQFCTKSKRCEIENSICINNKCQCKPNYVKHLNAECVPRQSLIYCEDNSDCVDTGQKCSIDNKCVCKENHISLSNEKCAPLLNGYCSTNIDCYVKNSVCVSKRCQCNFNHLPYSNYQCEPTMLGKLCATDLDCKHMKNSTCSADNVCVCKNNHFALNKFLCVPTFNGFCLDDHDCYSDSFQCSDNQCRCKSNHTAVSVDKCVETHSVSSCSDVSECSDPWHSICLPYGKCVCALNNVAVTPSTCLPILNGYCWKDDQCMADNSVCIDFRCQCKPKFIAVANNLCVSSNEQKI